MAEADETEKRAGGWVGGAHLRGADDGAAREEERHARGEVEGAREPHPGLHVELRPAGRAQPLDAGHGARERARVERPAVPRAAEAGHRHPRPAPRRRPRARLLRPRARGHEHGRRRRQGQQQPARRRHGTAGGPSPRSLARTRRLVLAKGPGLARSATGGNRGEWCRAAECRDPRREKGREQRSKRLPRAALRVDLRGSAGRSEWITVDGERCGGRFQRDAGRPAKEKITNWRHGGQRRREEDLLVSLSMEARSCIGLMAKPKCVPKIELGIYRVRL